MRSLTILSLLPFARGISFPAQGDIGLVFPRNDSYAPALPFPIIFGFSNTPALLSYASEIRWQLNCYYGTLFGLGSIRGDDKNPPPMATTDPWYYVNASTGCALCPPDKPFPTTAQREDKCKLTWEWHYTTICTKLPDGSTRISSGRGVQKGELHFTVKPGEKLPQDVIRSSKDCPLSMVSVNVVGEAITGCPTLGESEPQPCKLDVKAVASSLAEKAKPTTVGTASATSEAAQTSSAPAPTSSGSGSGSGGGSGNTGSGSDKKSSGRMNLDFMSGGFLSMAGVIPVFMAIF